MTYFTPNKCIVCGIEMMYKVKCGHTPILCSKKCRNTRARNIRKAFNTTIQGRVVQYKINTQTWMKKLSKEQLLYELAKVLAKTEIIENVLGGNGFEMLDKKMLEEELK